MAGPDAARSGDLLLIGGREDKLAEREVLRAVADRVGDGTLVICTLATREPDPAWQEYARVFAELGVARRAHLTIGRDGEDAEHETAGLDRASVVFFTGGDQLRLTSMLAGTATGARLLALHRQGVTIAGTSAGASVVSDAMLVGVAGRSHKLGDLLRMAPGLGFIRDVIVDQHFAQRGRIARLLGAVAQNPGHLGLGIDEDTACVIAGDRLSIIGAGALYVVDAHGATQTNVSEGDDQRVVTISDVRLHVLARGDAFDLATRRPLANRVGGASSRSCAHTRS
jgi:cyanophycinase